MSEAATKYPQIPADDLSRALSVTNAEESGKHIGLVGDTYTVVVSGEASNGRFCVIDMHVPPGGGPGSHRHDFEETFVVLDGEVEVTFRGVSMTAPAGTTVNIPANAPHHFHNKSTQAARMICVCSPAGTDKFFAELGVPVATRTTPPPAMDAEQMKHFVGKAQSLAPKYKTELLKDA